MDIKIPEPVFTVSHDSEWDGKMFGITGWTGVVRCGDTVVFTRTYEADYREWVDAGRPSNYYAESGEDAERMCMTEFGVVLAELVKKVTPDVRA